MAERPPSRPRVAWEEKGAPRERRSPPEPYEVTMVKPLEMDFEQVPLYREEKATMDFIRAFVRCPEEDTEQKMEFLDCIYMLFRAAKARYLTEGLDDFCYKYELAENVKMLLEKEPRDNLSTAVRWKAMLAIAELSSVRIALEGKEDSLLEACFSRVLSLPPKEEMQDTNLYMLTMNTMDTMLKTLVLNCPVFRISELVQMILQMLLDFTDSEMVAVQERALDRIKVLCNLVADNATLEFGRDTYDLVYHGDLQIPILGTLLGRLLLFYSSKERTHFPAFDALNELHRFVHNQKSRSVAKDGASRRDGKTDTSCYMKLCTARDFAMEFAKHLTHYEAADVVCVAIEALRDSSIFDKEAARNMLDLFMTYPGFWLVDVPKIMSCIRENLERINMESARQSMESLLLALTHLDPSKVFLSLLKFSATRDSDGRAMWEAMFCIPQTLEKILEELLDKLQGRKSCSPVPMATEKAYILHLALMASTQLQSDDWGNASQSNTNVVTALQLLRCLIPLSQTPDLAIKMKVLLPHLMELLQLGHINIKMNVLVIFQNVMHHLETKEASSIAVQLAENLLPIFDAASEEAFLATAELLRWNMDLDSGTHGSGSKGDEQTVLLGHQP
ncbi:PREDICTED: uncharacterized protein LOC106897821 [Calidris pugnax]|uniref:uncharacterized protein LOC106897821 n=1 Tax=Calidris pugnax TaxID=198806 RepID=UPI00071D71D3|nr:PREDICTED: uncharacterized protein LOC106897821 [Calidris pugnax]